MIIIRKTEKTRNKLNLEDPNFRQLEIFQQRPRTDYIIIHDTAFKTRFSGKYLTYDGLLDAYETRDPVSIGVHYIIEAGKEYPLIIKTGRPPSAVGNHAGPCFDKRSIGIAFIGNYDKRNPERAILTTSTISSLIFSLASTYKVPAEGIVTELEAYGAAILGIDCGGDREIIMKHIDRNPGYAIFKEIKQLRELMIGMGIEVRDIKKLRFFNDIIRSILRKRGIMDSIKTAQRVFTRKTKIERSIEKYLKQKAEKYRKFNDNPDLKSWLIYQYDKELAEIYKIDPGRRPEE